LRRFFMPKAKAEEKRWKDFERELTEAVKKDKTRTKQERQAWLDKLPEFVAPEGNMVKVVFFGANKRSGGKLRESGGRD
jgi:hypothetical protein